MAASVFAALSPLLAIVGVAPSSDAPTTWFVISGLWLLLIAAKRAASFGRWVPESCSARRAAPPSQSLYLCLFWALAHFFCAHASRSGEP
jgi:4-amino-4-deoxy-L-arabinose transferase-like glycosyltransferase